MRQRARVVFVLAYKLKFAYTLRLQLLMLLYQKHSICEISIVKLGAKGMQLRTAWSCRWCRCERARAMNFLACSQTRRFWRKTMIITML